MSARPFLWVTTDVTDEKKAGAVGAGQFEEAHGPAWQIPDRKRLEIAARLPHHFRVVDAEQNVILRGKVQHGPYTLALAPLEFARTLVDPAAAAVVYTVDGHDLVTLTPAGE